MNAPEVPPRSAPIRRRRRAVLAVGAVALLGLLLAVSLRFALQPARVTDLLLSRLGQALGLEITASGVGEYRLRGTPQLVVRGLNAKQPGSDTPVLQAERVFVSVPWSTIRSRGTSLDIRRVEVDGAALDLPALQRWLQTRPGGESRLPTLSEGLRVRNARISAGGWSVDGLSIDAPRFAADEAFAAHAQGRYLDRPLTLGFDLDIAMQRPALPTGVGIVGGIVAASGDWRAPARLRASGLASLHDGEFRATPLRIAAAARYESGGSRSDLALGLNTPMRVQGGELRLAPAFLALRGEGALPDLDASGQVRFGQRMHLGLAGVLREWNAAWPALPPPIGQSTSPLPFRLDYQGRSDGSDVTALRLRRDDTRFDAKFRLPALLAWVHASSAGSPLPPLDGTVTTPRMDISGARLEGVEIELDDPELDQTARDPVTRQ